MWTQTGITPGQVAGLAAALTVYDLLATGLSTTTISFVDQVAGKPFAPLLMSGFGARATFIGMGDCLLLTIWPLVAASTYGRLAASLAVAVDVLLLASIRIGFLTGLLVKPVPVATPLGILIVVQYLFWWRRTRPKASIRSFVDVALHPLPGVGTAPRRMGRGARREGSGQRILPRHRTQGGTARGSCPSSRHLASPAPRHGLYLEARGSPWA